MTVRGDLTDEAWEQRQPFLPIRYDKRGYVFLGTVTVAAIVIRLRT
jgi:hypothetical protein